MRRRRCLIIVDVQEDFLPPAGSLAVPGGRDVVPVINDLLKLHWDITVASLDWHPTDHVSFACNHSGVSPFSSYELRHPKDPSRIMSCKAWPVHCVQDSKGSNLSSELDTERIQNFVKKGQESDSEFYSVFEDVWGYRKTHIEALLREARIDEVYIVGLALDFCVFHSAVDSAKKGWKTSIIREAVRAVDPDLTEEMLRNLSDCGVESLSCSQLVGYEI